MARDPCEFMVAMHTHTILTGFSICLVLKMSKFYKNNRTDKIWWLDNADETVGEFVFTFDKNQLFNMFRDYPHNLTAEQKEIFDKENPFWADFFSP